MTSGSLFSWHLPRPARCHSFPAIFWRMERRRNRLPIRKDPFPYGFSAVDKPWVVATHASVLLVLIEPAFGALLGPLWFFILRGGESPGVEVHARDAFNFGVTISVFVAFFELLSVALTFVGVSAEYGDFGLLVTQIIAAGLAIRAVMFTRKGRSHHYPCAIQFLDDPTLGTSRDGIKRLP